MMRLLVTGGTGFIGSAVVRQAIAAGHKVVNYDALTYAACLDSLAPVADHPNYSFVQGNICDGARLAQVMARHQPDRVLHLAAESHVDRSIDGPEAFLQTNIMGTFTLLQAALNYWQGQGCPHGFRIHHVSTDEVFGSLGPTGQFSEISPYAPNSPYAASKAASDHLVRAWGETYDLPVSLSNCSNNYGPYHFPEKLIPLTILSALAGQPIPIYGAGDNVRDWLFVEDHARALLTIASQGQAGQTYAIGGNAEATNLDIVTRICAILDAKKPRNRLYSDLISFVPDRPGHDQRYAVDARGIQGKLGWQPTVDLDTGLARTVDWYLANPAWWQPLVVRAKLGQRLGQTPKRSPKKTPKKTFGKAA